MPGQDSYGPTPYAPPAPAPRWATHFCTKPVAGVGNVPCATRLPDGSMCQKMRPETSTHAQDLEP